MLPSLWQPSPPVAPACVVVRAGFRAQCVGRCVGLVRAAQQLSVDIRRPVTSMALLRDWRGALREGSGPAYQYAARLNALSQSPAMALRVHALSSVGRVRVQEKDQTFRMLRQGAAARAHAATGAGTDAWPGNTVSDNVVSLR